jgi:hypothetical protein
MSRLAHLALRSAIVIAGALVIGAALAPQHAQSRILATCTPTAYTPSVDFGQRIGQANGEATCDAGAPSWSYSIYLRNHAGSDLTSASGGPFTGNRLLGTNWVGCAGAVLHTFLYMNVGGTGKSDTSGEISGC